MKWMAARVGENAVTLSAMKSFIPGKIDGVNPHSPLEMLYLSAREKSSVPLPVEISEFEMLAYLIFDDEFRYLLEFKTSRLLGEEGVKLEPTKLDKLVELWEKIFPGNQILKQHGSMRFLTAAGDDTISALKLSQGEKTVLYYILATLYAPEEAVIFIDSPTLFIHPAMLNSLWNSIENMRRDCTFVYNTNDVEFLTSRTENACVWVKRYDVADNTWDYTIIDPSDVTDELLMVLMGSRKPVLFIEGDAKHSIDAKLYPLVFSDYTVRPLGSCDRVIESTRTFRALSAMHHLDSHGIVDRDRRTDKEVEYLRGKDILVPNVAEIENIFLLETVIKTMANRKGKIQAAVFRKVCGNVMRLWQQHHKAQALMHTRHRVKRLVECKIDARFNSISDLEHHLSDLTDIIRPHAIYDSLLSEFRSILAERDYAGVLKYFNHKPMLAESGIAHMLGYKSVDAYITGVLTVLKGNGRDAVAIRSAIRECFSLEGLPETN